MCRLQNVVEIGFLVLYSLFVLAFRFVLAATAFVVQHCQLQTLPVLSYLIAFDYLVNLLPNLRLGPMHLREQGQLHGCLLLAALVDRELFEIQLFLQLLQVLFELAVRLVHPVSVESLDHAPLLRVEGRLGYAQHPKAKIVHYAGERHLEAQILLSAQQQ